MKLCEAEDTDRIREYYRFVTDNTEHMPEYGRWIYGLHPSDEMIAEYVKENAVYFWEEEGDIIAAAVVTPYQPSDYHGIAWQVELEDDEVSVVHLLAVNPHFQNRGIAKKVMREIIAKAKETGKKAVRLDAIEGNLPAHKLYESLGFQMRGIRNWYAANLGHIDFYLFEYLL